MRITILTISILLIHEHGTSLHLFLSLIALSNALWWSANENCFFLLNWLLSNFLPDVIVNGIVLISFSDCLALVHRNTISFCILILYPVTLLNSVLVGLCVCVRLGLPTTRFYHLWLTAEWSFSDSLDGLLLVLLHKRQTCTFARPGSWSQGKRSHH